MKILKKDDKILRKKHVSQCLICLTQEGYESILCSCIFVLINTAV